MPCAFHSIRLSNRTHWILIVFLSHVTVDGRHHSSHLCQFWHICPSVTNIHKKKNRKVKKRSIRKLESRQIGKKKKFCSWAMSQLADENRGGRGQVRTMAVGYILFFCRPRSFPSSYFFFLHCAYIKKMHVWHCPSTNQRVRSSKIRS